MTIRAYRSAFTAPHEELGPYHVTLRPAEANEPPRHAMDLAFRIPAGKGYSDLYISIQPEDFARIAQAMMDVNPNEAIRAFGAAMLAGCRARDEVAYFASLADELSRDPGNEGF